MPRPPPALPPPQLAAQPPPHACVHPHLPLDVTGLSTMHELSDEGASLSSNAGPSSSPLYGEAAYGGSPRETLGGTPTSASFGGGATPNSSFQYVSFAPSPGSVPTQADFEVESVRMQQPSESGSAASLRPDSPVSPSYSSHDVSSNDPAAPVVPAPHRPAS